MSVSVADQLVSQLWDQGLRQCFGCLSHLIEPLPQSLARQGMPTLIAATETGAGYMAQGLTLSGAGPGLVFCGGGPGLAMLLPALQAARLDRIPILALVGQTGRDGYPRFQCTQADGSRDRQLLQAMGIATRHLAHPADLPQHLADLLGSLEASEPAVLTVAVDVLAAASAATASESGGGDTGGSGGGGGGTWRWTELGPPPQPTAATPSLSAPAPGSYREVVAALVECLPAATLWFGDAGQTRHAMATELGHRRLVCLQSAASGPMGWAIAAAIGAAAGQPRRPVCCFTGDGSALLLGNEMATAVRGGLPVTFVVAANGVLGNPHGRLRDTAAADLCRLPAVDWCLWGRSLGLPAVNVTRPSQIAAALASLPAAGPRLLVVPVPSRDPQVIPPYGLQQSERT